MTDLVWQDPPPPISTRNTGKGKVQAFVAQLQANPGRWAIYPKPAKNVTAGAGMQRRYPGTRFVTRKNDDGTWTVYGMWIGDGQ